MSASIAIYEKDTHWNIVVRPSLCRDDDNHNVGVRFLTAFYDEHDVFVIETTESHKTVLKAPFSYISDLKQVMLTAILTYFQSKGVDVSEVLIFSVFGCICCNPAFVTRATHQVTYHEVLYAAPRCEDSEETADSLSLPMYSPASPVRSIAPCSPVHCPSSPSRCDFVSEDEHVAAQPENKNSAVSCLPQRFRKRKRDTSTVTDTTERNKVHLL